MKASRIIVADVMEGLRQLPDGSVHCNRGRFRKGTHWRNRKPWWDRAWLMREYVDHGRSASAIAAAGGCDENNILYWLNKHGIPRRSVREARTMKHWGSSGSANPMYGKRGPANPNWQGGNTPMRQRIYASAEWKSFARRIRRRDKCCRKCGSSSELHIHHIETFAVAPLLVMDDGNAILLCAPCHRRMQGRERMYAKELLSLLEQKGDQQYGRE